MKVTKLPSIKEQLRLRRIEAREAYELANKTGLDKLNAILSFTTNIPLNILYNREAKKKGLRTKPIFSSVTDFSDYFEIRRPELIDNKNWNRWKQWMNIGLSIGLDPLTYVTAGFTKAGKAKSLLKNMGAVPFEQGGKIGYRVSRLHGKDLIDEAGKRITKEFTEEAFKKNLGEKGYNILKEGGAFKEQLTQLPIKLHDQIAMGDRGVKMFGRPILKKSLSSFVKNVDFIADKIIESENVFAKAGVKAFFPEKYLFKRSMLKENPNATWIDIVRDFESISGKQALYIKQAKELKGKLDKSIVDIRLKQGLRAPDPKNYVPGTSLTREELMKYSAIMENPDYVKGKTKLGKDIEIYGDIPNVAKVGGKTPKDINFTKYAHTRIDKQFLDDFSDVIEDMVIPFSERNKLRTSIIQNAKERLGISMYLRSNYIKGIPNALLNETVENVVKAPKVGKALSGAIKTIAGEKKIIRDFTLAQAEVFMSTKKYILSSKEVDSATKIVFNAIDDGRLARGNHTVQDIIDFTKQKGFEDKLKKASKRASSEITNEVQIEYETLEGMKRFVENIYKAEKNITGKNKKELIKKIRGINLGDKYDVLMQKQVQDIYNFSLPIIEFMTNVETEKKVKAFKFLEKFFDEELGHLVKITPEKEIEEGFEKLNRFIITDVDEWKAKNFLKERFNPKAGTRYVYSVRSDVMEELRKTKILEALENPSKAIDKNIIDYISGTLDWVNKWLVRFTLFPFPAYYFRNIIDDTTRMSLDGVKLRHHQMADSYLATMHPELRAYQKIGKKVSPDTKITGLVEGDISYKDFQELIYDKNILGHGVREINEQGFRPVEAIRKALLSEPVTKQTNDKLKLLDKVTKEWIPKTPTVAGNKISEVFDNLIDIQRNIDAHNRVATLLAMMENYDTATALKRMSMITLSDYNLTPIERSLINRVFIFYTFKRNAIKYIVNSYLERPQLIKAFVKFPHAIEKTILDPEKEINKVYLSDWLKQASLQWGVDKDGRPTIINLRGLTTLAEIVSFIQPAFGLKESLFPQYKSLLELYANEDYYFKTPLEQYEGEKKVVLGFPVKARSLTAQFLGKQRLPSTIVEVTETLLKGSPISIFGTKEKKSLGGFGTVSRYNPPGIRALFAKKIFGIPVTTYDVERGKLSLMYSIKDKQKNLNTSIQRISKRFGKDPKFARKEIERKLKEYNKQRTKWSDTMLSYKNPRSYFEIPEEK